ncbi:MerR family transcriptional regulator [Salipiger mangrovisoli]|uniref:MerR family transcriptional regulator n=1 Tax=Salipiger mangrovisoli TaxID=2865933 RepID=A0ABR9X3S5_9RHOB|nr:MerR family transcriptional regulator [Salipiger mangrovisoli]MBE9638161.1 MerR family transcriptional regulator [Salipiger mangrovisoli]
MSKSRDAFRTISEVAELLDTPAHVLRFWETKFSQVKPVKRAGGRRYYRPNDVALLAGIRQLLHDDGLTIKGVQKVLREQGVRHVAGIAPPSDLLDEAVEYPAQATDLPEAPEAVESATVLPFAPAAGSGPDIAANPGDLPEQKAPRAAEDPEAALSAGSATPLFPEITDPEPHPAAQAALWEEDPAIGDMPAQSEAPKATDDHTGSGLPGFITDSLAERGAEPLPAEAVSLPEIPDLTALPVPAPGVLGLVAQMARIDSVQAAALAPHVAALRDFVAARAAARLT